MAVWGFSAGGAGLEDEWVHLALAQRLRSQPHHDDDDLPPHSTKAAVADADTPPPLHSSHFSGVDFRAASASHSMESLLRLLSMRARTT